MTEKCVNCGKKLETNTIRVCEKGIPPIQKGYEKCEKQACGFCSEECETNFKSNCCDCSESCEGCPHDGKNAKNNENEPKEKTFIVKTAVEYQFEVEAKDENEAEGKAIMLTDEQLQTDNVSISIKNSIEAKLFSQNQCPNCGGEANEHFDWDSSDANGNTREYPYTCGNCGFQGKEIFQETYLYTEVM